MQDLGTEKITAQTLYGHTQAETVLPAAPGQCTSPHVSVGVQGLTLEVVMAPAPRSYYQPSQHQQHPQHHSQQDMTPRDDYNSQVISRLCARSSNPGTDRACSRSLRLGPCAPPTRTSAPQGCQRSAFPSMLTVF